MMNKNIVKKEKIPRWDRWDIRIINEKEQQKLIDLFHKSGAKTKSDFVRSQIFREDFKIIKVDKSKDDYYHRLSELTAQVHKIGVLYNQSVRAINSYHSLTIAQNLLQKLEVYTTHLSRIIQEVITLTKEYRDK